MKRPFIILFVLFSAILFAGERGLTVKEIEVSGEAISISSPVQSLIQVAPLRKVEKAHRARQLLRKRMGVGKGQEQESIPLSKLPPLATR